MTDKQLQLLGKIEEFCVLMDQNNIEDADRVYSEIECFCMIHNVDAGKTIKQGSFFLFQQANDIRTSLVFANYI